MSDVDGATVRPRSRHGARKQALDLLYSADLRQAPIAGILRGALETDAAELSDYAITIVRGVATERAELDAIISASSSSWRIERMPVVDRNVLRLALWELLHAADVPAAVAIDEAVELAKELSTDDSGRFVNGVLGRVARDRGLVE